MMPLQIQRLRIQRSFKSVHLTTIIFLFAFYKIFGRNVHCVEQTSVDQTNTIPGEHETCAKSQTLIRDGESGEAVFPLTPHRALLGSIPTEVYYMLPSDLSDDLKGLVGKAAHAVLVHFHGCNHSGADMFLLPEDRRVAFSALKRGFAVLSISSANKSGRGCWKLSDDLPSLKSTFLEFRNLVGLAEEDAPAFGMGASSGGSFLFRGAVEEIGLRALASYVSLGPGVVAGGGNYVPTVFVYMPRDVRNEKVEKVRLSMTPAATEALAVAPSPFNASVCRSRIPEIAEICDGVVETLLHRTGLLSETYDLLRRPALADTEILSELFSQFSVEHSFSDSLPDRDFKGQSWAIAAVQEELAHAYARHEMSSEHIEEVLVFFEKHVQLSN